MTATALAATRIDRVGSANKLDVGAEDASVANGNCAGVGDATISADKDVVADVDVVAVVAMEGCLDDDILTNTTNRHNTRLRGVAVRGRFERGTACHDVSETALALLGTRSVRRVGGIVEAPDRSHTILAVLGQGWTEGVVVVPFEHLVALSHIATALRW